MITVDNITIEQAAQPDHYSIAVRSDIGDREQQQDQAYLNVNGDCVFTAVCDGMGGALDGEVASKAAVSAMRCAYADFLLDKNSDVPAFLYQAMAAADRAVASKMTRGVGGDYPRLCNYLGQQNVLGVSGRQPALCRTLRPDPSGYSGS